MPNNTQFNFRVHPVPQGEPVTADQIEARMIAQLNDPAADHKQALHNLAVVYSSTQRYDEARRCLDSLLEMMDNAEDKARSLLNIGCLMEQRRDFGAAVTFYQAAFSLEPCSNHVWYFIHNNLGYSLNQLGKFKEAAPYLRSAIQIDPTRSNAHKNLGLSLQGAGNWAGAAACYIDATKANSTDERSLKHLNELIANHPELLNEMPTLKTDLKNCVKAVEWARSLQPDMDAHWKEARGELEKKMAKKTAQKEDGSLGKPLL